MKRTAFTLACMLLTPCFSEQTADAENLDAVPEMPEEVPEELRNAEEALEPEVTIIRRQDALVREYRVNGQLYMIKVSPNRGPAYYLVDSNGDGMLDMRGEGLAPKNVFQWILFRW